MNEQNKTPAEPSAPALSVVASSGFYTILSDYSTYGLEVKVTKCMGQGYRLVGGVSATSDRDMIGNENRMFYQAVAYYPNK